MAGSITRVSPSHDPGQTLAPLCRCGRRNRSKHGRPPAPPEGHAEPRSAAGAVGAADRARSGAERRNQTAVTNKEPAHNGTSGALAGGKHTRRRAAWATPRTCCGAPRRAELVGCDVNLFAQSTHVAECRRLTTRSVPCIIR